MYIDDRLFVLLVICGLIVLTEIIAFFVWSIKRKYCVTNKPQQEDLDYQKRLHELKQKEDENKCTGIIDDIMETRPSIKSIPSGTRGHKHSNATPGETPRRRKSSADELEIEIKRNNSSNLSAEFFQEGEQPSQVIPDPGQEVNETPSTPERDPDLNGPQKYDV